MRSKQTRAFKVAKVEKGARYIRRLLKRLTESSKK